MFWETYGVQENGERNILECQILTTLRPQSLRA